METEPSLEQDVQEPDSVQDTQLLPKSVQEEHVPEESKYSVELQLQSSEGVPPFEQLLHVSVAQLAPLQYGFRNVKGVHCPFIINSSELQPQSVRVVAPFSHSMQSPLELHAVQ